jgi:hypothetical protein
VLLPPVPSLSSWSKGVYAPRGFILHAALLRQGFPHCAKFPTAASRRSLDRVSVPVWPCALSGRLPIFALVGRYPANWLISRDPLFKRIAALILRCYAVLASVSRGYPPLEGRLVTCYSPGRHFTHGLLHFLVRLACVRHAASVDSEPGSNSRLKPDVCRRVVGRLPSPHIQCSLQKLLWFQQHGMAPPFSLHSHPKTRKKFMVVYLVRSFRTYARIRSLTTGTFNLVVKDRIAFRLSGANSVQANPLARANPTVLETF